MILERWTNEKGGKCWMWKTPFRRRYCESFKIWIKSIFECHIILRFFPSIYFKNNME